MQEFRKINIVKEAGNFRKEMAAQLASVGENEYLIDQIKDVMANGDEYSRLMLIAQLNIFCIGSPRRSGLLKHRLNDDEFFTRLIQQGLFNNSGVKANPLISSIIDFEESVSSTLENIRLQLCNLRGSVDFTTV